MVEKKSIDLLIVCTNKYVKFIEQMLDSAEKFFMKGHDVRYKVFTDKVKVTQNMMSKKPYKDKIDLIKINHGPWPYATLYRFHFFLQNFERLNGDYMVYVDVDACFAGEITAEILSDRTAVMHCGYIGERGTFDNNPKSEAYVNENEGFQYYGGGFWSFKRDEFNRMIKVMVDRIDRDDMNGVRAVWNDESHLNRWLIDNPPTLVLSPSYHYPEKVEGHAHIHQKWQRLGVQFEPKVLLLHKNHDEIRD